MPSENLDIMKHVIEFSSSQLFLTLFSGFAGGLLGSVVAIFSTSKQISSAQKINKETINTYLSIMQNEMNEREMRYKKEKENFILNRTYEERKKVCCDFLLNVDPTNLGNIEHDVSDAYKCLKMIQIFCNKEYFDKATTLFNDYVGHKKIDIYKYAEPYTIPTNASRAIEEFSLYRINYDKFIEETFHYLVLRPQNK